MAMPVGLQATENGWQLPGLQWYWWLVMMAGFAGWTWFQATKQNLRNALYLNGRRLRAKTLGALRIINPGYTEK